MKLKGAAKAKDLMGLVCNVRSIGKRTRLDIAFHLSIAFPWTQKFLKNLELSD